MREQADCLSWDWKTTYRLATTGGECPARSQGEEKRK